jgi:adenylate cyclase class 2
MLEIEMKFPVTDLQKIGSKLASWGYVPDPSQRESDHYFNAPDRNFARTDEALRLRRIGRRNRVTYKGPRLSGPEKSRVEIEVELAEGDTPANDFDQLLQNLGYRLTAVVRKQRTIYHLERKGFTLEVCLDDVDGVGRFVELEILAPAEQLDAARTVLAELASELELTDSERRSYLEMLLARTP